MNTDRIYKVIVPLMRPVVRRHARRRRRDFLAETPTLGHILLLGDSITEQGDWRTLLPDLPTVNRGVGGDSTEDILARVDEAVASPSVISLLIGTNDLHKYRRLDTDDGIVARTNQILVRLGELAPDAAIILNSVMPRTGYYAERLRAINRDYREIASRHGATFLDLWPVLADQHGVIDKQLTADNLHLNGRGYAAWVRVLEPALKRAVGG